MMYDIIAIVVGLVIFFAIEQVPYWMNLRRKFILRIENERLEIYLELQRLCLNSTFKRGRPEHDTLTFLSERYPSLPFFHVLRILFDKKYRRKYEDAGEEIEKKTSAMPENAKNLLGELQIADIKLVAVHYPMSFMLLIFFAIILFLRSRIQSMWDMKNIVSGLLVQKTPSGSVILAA